LVTGPRTGIGEIANVGILRLVTPGEDAAWIVEAPREHR
jgi:hypothetical protein